MTQKPKIAASVSKRNKTHMNYNIWAWLVSPREGYLSDQTEGPTAHKMKAGPEPEGGESNPPVAGSLLVLFKAKLNWITLNEPHYLNCSPGFRGSTWGGGATTTRRRGADWWSVCRRVRGGQTRVRPHVKHHSCLQHLQNTIRGTLHSQYTTFIVIINSSIWFMINK